MEGDDLELDKIGDRKTALFCIVSDTGGVTKQLKLELDYAKMIVNKQEDLTWLR